MDNTLGPWGYRCWIVTAPRTGSTWLSYLLNNAIGLPIGLSRWKKLSRYSFGEHMQASHCPTRADFLELDPVVSKVHNHQLGDMFPGWSRADVESQFPRIRFVHLYRENKYAQAFSLYASDTTGACRLQTGVALEAYQHVPIPFDEDQLVAKYQQVLSYESNWDRWLAGRARLSLSYEAIHANPAQVVASILDFLHTPYTQIPLDVPINKMTRPEAEEYTQRLKDIINRP